MQMNENTCVQIFYKMMKARLFEEMCVRLKEKGFINDELYLSYGQEAAAAGVCALSVNDIIFTSHRNITVSIAANMSTDKMFAELMGLKEGTCAGRSGMSAFCDSKLNCYGGSPLAGAAFSKAVGTALALRLKGENRAVICFAGDGAASMGQFFEAVNFAAQKKLSVVFFIENNCYAGKQRTDAVNNINDIAQRADGFALSGIITDGNSPKDVYTATLQALEYSKQNRCPVVLEAKTYRLAGHTYEEIQDYRNESEVEGWLKYDPIENHTRYMIERRMGAMEDFILLRSKIKDEIDSSVEKAFEMLSKSAAPKNAEVFI